MKKFFLSIILAFMVVTTANLGVNAQVTEGTKKVVRKTNHGLHKGWYKGKRIGQKTWHKGKRISVKSYRKGKHISYKGITKTKEGTKVGIGKIKKTIN